MIKDWVQLNGPNMGDYLPERLKKQTYTIGIYAYSGASLDSSDNKTVNPVTSPPPAGSLEDLLKAANHPSVFVDFLHTKKAKELHGCLRRVQRCIGVSRRSK